MVRGDGDFNDLVFYVSGVSCAGGGERCDTELAGACAIGRTDWVRPGTAWHLSSGGATARRARATTSTATVTSGRRQRRPSARTTWFASRAPVSLPARLAGAPTGSLVARRASASISSAPPLLAIWVLPAAAALAWPTCNGVLCPTGEECQLGRCVDPLRGRHLPGEQGL